jgi:predicted nucleic acid binding AN1-type Zn finger protein
MQELVCVCGKEFCLSHRLPESHDCTFNMREKHMESAQTQISAMKCVHEKINKI